MDIVAINILIGIGMWYGNLNYDRELKAYSPTFERRSIADHSDTYYKMNRAFIIIHAISLCSVFLEFVTGKLGIPDPIPFIFEGIGWLFFFADMPIVTVYILVANRRRKKWRRLSRNKLKLTNKERRELEAAVYRSKRRSMGK